MRNWLKIFIIDHTLPLKVKKEHGHDRDMKTGVSPHMLKCTEYMGRMYMMGQCYIGVRKEEKV